MNSEPPFTAILFDLDETLLNRQAALMDYCKWQATQCFAFDELTVQKYVHRFIQLDAAGSVWKDQVYRQLKQEFPIPDTVNRLVSIYLSQFQRFCTANPNVAATLADLSRQGYLSGLISNGKSPFQENNFNHLGLNRYFSTVIVSEAVNLRKPDPEIFQLACARLAVQPEQCIFVGDNELADIQGAIGAGMYAVKYARDSTEIHSQAHAVIHDFADLPEAIRTIARHTIEKPDN
ncbi:HAD family hydrolase [Acinetobacter sp. WZC-1]|uniref:HAD family hydrolase n=1 Tax=Acinetobacter sp. WZC-1 TaxID=3459034 RepID=UPI00403DFB85